MFKFSVCLTESPVSKGLPLKIYRQLKVERSMIMCYNPQMSCDAIEKHNYGLKLLREIKQVGVIETIDFTLSKWTPNSTPNRNLKEHVQSEYPLTSCFAVLFHFQASFERITPRSSSFFFSWQRRYPEAIKAVKKQCSICRKLVNTPLKLSNHSFSRMPSVVHRK